MPSEYECEVRRQDPLEYYAEVQLTARAELFLITGGIGQICVFIKGDVMRKIVWIAIDTFS
jgi:hypothetical protein